MQILARVAAYAAALWVATAFLDGLDVTGGWLAFAVIAVILAAINTLVKPLVKLLAFPLIILSLGLFLLIINAVLLQATIYISEALELGFTSTSFATTFVGAAIVAVVAWIGETILAD